MCCILLVTGSQLLFAYPENHVEIWLVILFLSRKKFHAKQIVVLSSSMKLGPGIPLVIMPRKTNDQKNLLGKKYCSC